MATLILTAAGTAIGGPLGGAVGALLGQRVDRAVLGAGKREGPRLSDLKVQTSSYGTEIPRLFGTMRVAGTVIWAADLQESFAVALSSRPIGAVLRIWADGNLLRGSAGDFKVRTGFRLHAGGEDQAVDPLIASAEGVGLAPAHRGIAYAVFEGLELAEYGNRIPSLTFEVVADAGTMTSGAVVRALAGEVMAADDGLALGGFAAGGGSVRAVLETLAAASGGWFAPAGSGLAFRTGGAAARVIEDAGVGGARGARTVAAAGTVPGAVAVTHYDAARDYQSGLQRARLPGGSMREERVEVPAVLGATAARDVAEAVLARREAERVRRTVAPGLAALDVVPGDVVAIAGESGRWRVSEAALEGMAVVLTLVPIAAAGMPGGAATSGRVQPQADAVAGRTLVAVFEAPALDGALLAAPRVLIAATGEGAGWRRASLLVSTDAGASWDEAEPTALPAVIGTLAVPPRAGGATLIDLAGTIEVELARADVVLAPADDAALDRGANLAILGEELIQFGDAEPIGAKRWRLSRLLRGRRGTEWAAGAQVPGDRFVLIEAASVRAVALPAGTTGVRVLASGVADATPAEASAVLTGASLRPPSVAHLRWAPHPDGAQVRWVRRSRAGWAWVDGVDVPLGEDAERYRVIVVTADGATEIETDGPELVVPRPCTVTVCQRGTVGDSRPATIAVPA